MPLTGNTPLNDMPLGQTYGGVASASGGLYPNSTNTRPPAHLASGLDIAQNQIKPLDASGNVDLVNGKIVLLSIGMSNAYSEFGNANPGQFKYKSDLDPARNPKLTVVNGAESGETATDWTDYINDPQHTWSTAIQRIASASATQQQVQTVWLKESDSYRTTDWGTFPNNMNSSGLQGRLVSIIHGIHYYFPNAKITYISGRTRAWTTGGNLAQNLNPEPRAYETSFADKWVIEQQINGDPTLNFDPSKGAVNAPWLSWGPYLWADGITPRSDGLTWPCTNTNTTGSMDYTHPSSGAGKGQDTAANELLAFFKTDPTATPWFLTKTVNGTPPTCASTSNVSQGAAPLPVLFTSAASGGNGGIVQYAWTYDDGDYSLQANPSKTFALPGVYNVKFTASDSVGNTATCTVPITVTLGGPPNPKYVTVVFNDTADTTISQASPDSNYGSNSTMQTVSSTNHIQRILTHFSLYPASIPDGVIIDSATLTLTPTTSASPGSLYQASGSWAESTVTWNNAPAVGTLLMNLPGTTVAGTAYQANITPLISGHGEYDFYLNSSSSTAVVYKTKEGNPSLQPTLTVIYHAPIVSWNITARPYCAATGTLPNQNSSQTTTLYTALWPPNPLTWAVDGAKTGSHVVAMYSVDISNSGYAYLTDNTSTVLVPVSTVPANSDFVLAQFFNPPTWMFRWSRALPGGNYILNYQAPAAWCP